MKIVLFVIFVVLILSSCTKDKKTKEGYVAKIDGITLSKEYLTEQMNTLPEAAKQFFQGPGGMERFVDELVKKELLYLEAKKRGLDRDKEFQKRLEEFKKITLINALLDKEIEASPQVTEEEIKDYYEKNKEDFIINKQIRVSQILVKTEEDLNKVKEKLDKGEDFAKIASEMSADKTSRKAGGDIGFIKRGELSQDIERVIFSLKKGEISSPLKVNDGYRIIKITDMKGSIIEFEKVKGLINQRLIAEKQKESFDKLIEKIKKNYKIEINKDEISKIASASNR
ncbi:MAG: peptidylprolyl isomerase [Thermodesulfovibrionales bacterium]|nr:peptidylprolyl isomerase [Thermodesulfovibrionales bacterium]